MTPEQWEAVLLAWNPPDGLNRDGCRALARALYDGTVTSGEQVWDYIGESGSALQNGAAVGAAIMYRLARRRADAAEGVAAADNDLAPGGPTPPHGSFEGIVAELDVYPPTELEVRYENALAAMLQAIARKAADDEVSADSLVQLAQTLFSLAQVWRAQDEA